MASLLADIFDKLNARRDLTVDESRAVFEQVMAGELAPAAIGALLGAIATKGECVDELVGAARAMRTSAVAISCDADCIDTCGTGGDGVSTFNTSTTAAIIAAAAGATVAKHGNRSTTRASGSTEVLTHLGVDVEASPAIVERCLSTIRIGYLNARTLHPAMKHAAPVRRAIPARTIFNLLGPLTNPAGARRQILGVPKPELTELIATALLQLGSVHAWVVHGDGLCDLTITGPTSVVELKNGKLDRFTVSPEDVGLRRASLDLLRIDSPAQSACIVTDILAGKEGAPRDHALMNAGAALVVANIVANFKEGVERSAEAIDNGSARATLQEWQTLAPAPST